ncbi:MAG TPA: hypothetical protein VGD06_10285 [Acidobacteriota bacterium]|jgi:hypothetical protein
MNALRDYGWLLFGAAAAILLPAFGAGGALAAALDRVAPLPWARIAFGALIFAAAAALHFRTQLIRSLDRRRQDIERQGAASRLIQAATDDGRRWLLVIQENLVLIEDEGQRPPDKKLYLEGARAHADKLEQAFERIDGNRRRLDEPPS